MFESKSGILYIAGIGFFALAFVSNAVVPWLMYKDIPEKTVPELVNSNLRYQFEDLARRYPDSFKASGKKVLTSRSESRQDFRLLQSD